MTKRDMGAFWLSRNNVMDLHIAIRDNDMVDQQFHKLSFLLKISLF